MKRFILLSLAIGIFFIPEAMAAPAEAVFSGSSRDRIQVVIDGQIVNRIPERDVYVKGRPGMHAVQINIYNHWGRIKTTYHNRIHFRPFSQTRYIVEVDPYRGVQLVEMAKPPVPGHIKRPPKVRENYNYPRHTNLRLMADDEFFSLKNNMSRQRNDHNRMVAAKRALKTKSLSSEDVKELALLFKFEDSRVAFAKLAYSRTSDPANFRQMVYPVFRHPSSLRHMDAYLAKGH